MGNRSQTEIRNKINWFCEKKKGASQNQSFFRRESNNGDSFEIFPQTWLSSLTIQSHLLKQVYFDSFSIFLRIFDRDGRCGWPNLISENWGDDGFDIFERGGNWARGKFSLLLKRGFDPPKKAPSDTECEKATWAPTQQSNKTELQIRGTKSVVERERRGNTSKVLTTNSKT